MTDCRRYPVDPSHRPAVAIGVRRIGRRVVALGLLVAGIVLGGPALGAASASWAPDVVADAKPPAPGPAQGTLGFGVAPTDGGKTGQRAMFVYGLDPGGSAVDKVAVLNYSPTPRTFELYAVDAVNTDDGQFALRTGAEKNVDLGAWVNLKTPKRTVSVPGRDKKGQPGMLVVPFTIQVPKAVSPGDHAAGIVAVASTLGINKDSQNVRLDQRVAARVYVRIRGDLKPQLAARIDSTSYEAPLWPWQSGKLTVHYRVANPGNVRMGMKPTLTASGPFGVGSQTVDLEEMPEFLPHTTRSAVAVLEGVWPTGRLNVELVGTPVRAVAAPEPGIGPIRVSASLWVFSPSWLIVLLLLLLGLFWYAVRRRRRRAPADRPETPERAKAAAIVGALLLVTLTPLPFAGTRASAATGGLVIEPVSGDKITVPFFTAPAACSADAVQQVTQVTHVTAANPAQQGLADKWRQISPDGVLLGTNFYSPTDLMMPKPVHYNAGMSWNQVANTAGLTLVAGKYEVNMFCQDVFGSINYDTWTNMVTVDAAGNWVAQAVAVNTATRVRVSPATPKQGEAVTFTATVSPDVGPAPTGQVEFRVDGVAVGLATLTAAQGQSTATAVFQTSALAAGDHVVGARYLGTSANVTSSSDPVRIHVTSSNAADVSTATSLTVSADSTTENQPVVLTATVSPTQSGKPTPTGSVTFLADGKVLSVVALNGGVATLRTTLPPGQVSLGARYEPQSGFVSSLSPTVLVTVVAADRPATVSLAVAPATAIVGETVTLTATVTSGKALVPNGSVAFRADGELLCEGKIDKGIAACRTSTLPTGRHTVAAVVSASGYQSATSSPSVVTIRTSADPSKEKSSVSLAVTPTKPAAGQAMSAEVKVVGSPGKVPTGDIVVFDGTSPIGAGKIGPSGTARVALAGMPEGRYVLTAMYAGDLTYAAASAAESTLIVGPPVAAPATRPATSSPGINRPGGAPTGPTGSTPGTTNGSTAHTGSRASDVLRLGVQLLVVGACLIALSRAGRWRLSS